jgi:outer membrane protein assembly factor BamB
VIEPAAVVRLTGRSAAGLAAVGDSLWVSHFEGSTLSEVDMAADEEVGTVDVGRHPGSIRGLDGQVFVTHYGVPKDDQRIGALNPSGNAVQRTDPVGPLCCELVDAGDALWTVAVDGRLLRVDPDLEVTEAARTAANSDFHIGVVSTGDAVWVASEDSQVERYDAASGKRATTVDAGGGIPVAEGGGMLWGARPDTIWGLDATTGEQRAEFPLEDVSEILSGAVAGPDLWLSVRDNSGLGKVLRIEAATGVVTGEAEVNLPTNMLVAGDSLWVTDWSIHSVVRFALS